MSSSEKLTMAYVHGAGQHPACFDKMAALAIAEGCDTLAPSLPIEDPEATQADYAQCVVDEIQDRENIVLVGHSMGGRVAPRVATKLSSQVRALVIMSTFIEKPQNVAPPNVPVPPRYFPGYLESFLEVEDCWRVLNPEKAPYALFDGLDGADTARMRELQRKQYLFNEAEPLQRWPNVRTLVIYGQNEQVVQPEHIRFSASYIGENAHGIRGGHYLPLEEPELATKHILNFAANRPSIGGGISDLRAHSPKLPHQAGYQALGDSAIRELG